MQLKSVLMDEAAVRRTLRRMTHEIIERDRELSRVVLVGIRRRGVPLAQMLADNIREFEGVDLPVGYIDITLYRDDLSQTSDMPVTRNSRIDCDITGKTVILTDDVIYTGRTVRAAIEAVFSFGRPAAVQLAVLVDRGHRELPLRPDFVGKNVPTSREEAIGVMVPEIDGALRVELYTLA